MKNEEKEKEKVKVKALAKARREAKEKTKDPNSGSSLSPKLKRLKPEVFKKFFTDKCKTDTRTWEQAYKDVGGTLDTKPTK